MDMPSTPPVDPGSGASDALRAAEVRLQAVVDNAPIGIWIWEDWKVTYYSRWWARILGTEAPPGPEVPHWAELLIPEHRERAISDFRAAVREGRPYEGDGQVACADGTRRSIWLRAIPVHDLRTGQLFYQGFAVDITERLELEERLRQAQKMEAVAELAGRVATDFGTLLTAISSQIQLMQMDTGPEHPLQRHLDEITRAADHAGTLIRQLMAVSRQQGLERTPLDLNRVITDLRRMVQRVLEPSVRLVDDLAPDLYRVYADPGQVEQVLLNLWLNARDAMPSGGELTVRTRNVELTEEHRRTHPEVKPGHHVELTVADTGRGMDTAARDRLFEPFFSTASGGRGGLGLAMAYGIVRQHEGCVEVDSSPGTGTTVRVWLPAIAEQVAVAVAPESEPVRGGREMVLVGEDDPLTLGFTESTLVGMGYRVLTATHSEEVIKAFQQHRDEIDLVVLDVVMPTRGGREVAREIKAARPDLRILFVSGYLLPPGPGGEGWPEAEDFLPKPFSPTSLGRKVREVLDRRSPRSG
jgi:two-component system, cell cycle sensor histidine kinase and response regulator CckA